MDSPLDTHVLVLADDAAQARRWAVALAPAAAVVWLGLAEVPAGARQDVVVVADDGAVEPERPVDALPAAEPPPPTGNSGQSTDAAAPLPPGVIRLGGSLGADVRLPRDATPRELQLAVRLLAEVVRLRRQLQAVSHVQHRLTREALTDPLTGLPNRRAWDEGLAAQLMAAGSRADRLCLAIIDLDNFKRVNDGLGHPAGDAVLRDAADRLRHSLRQDDFVARLGGDEFGLLLWVPAVGAAGIIVDRVRCGIRLEARGPAGDAITASAGYSLAPKPSASAPLPCPDALFSAADEALRAAKQRGRDRTIGGRE